MRILGYCACRAHGLGSMVTEHSGLVVFNVDMNLGMMCLEHGQSNHVSQNSLKAYGLAKLYLLEHKT